jgi:hypothetical protein
MTLVRSKPTRSNPGRSMPSNTVLTKTSHKAIGISNEIVCILLSTTIVTILGGFFIPKKKAYLYQSK